jgi:hypothetical protein
MIRDCNNAFSLRDNLLQLIVMPSFARFLELDFVTEKVKINSAAFTAAIKI